MNGIWRETAHRYALSESLAGFLVWIPIAMAILSPILIGLPITRQAFIVLVSENRPVELLTFLFLIVGAFIAARLARLCQKHGEPAFVSVFYVLYGIGMFVVGMEEIAWGQWFIGFETPESIRQLNAQGELTIHNLRGLHGGSEFFYVSFCFAAAIGIALRGKSSFETIAAPTVLVPYLAVIGVYSLGELYCDYFPAPRGIAFAFARNSEVIEMLIGMAAFLYSWLNSRLLSMYRYSTNPTVSYP